MKQWITAIIAVSFFFLTFGVLSACKSESNIQGEQGVQVGADKDGAMPTIAISEDGYWVINGVKTEYKATEQEGENGCVIESVYYDANGDLVVVYTDKTEQTVTLPTHTHMESAWIVDTEATCDTQGLRHKECMICHTYMEIGLTQSKGGHIYKRGSCTVCGDFQTQGLSFVENEDGESFDVLIGECTDSEIYIPAYYKKKPVVSVNFGEDSQLLDFVREVYIPNTVKDFTFAQCPNIEKVCVEDNSSLKKIGEKAFYNCSALRELDLGENNKIQSIEAWAFYGCSSLKSITLPETVTTIARYAVAYCRSLTDMTIPNSVENIGDGAFAGCKSLKTVQLSNRLKTIEEEAFIDTGILSVTIPASVEKLGSGAFRKCESLKTVTIEKDSQLQSISIYAFLRCYALEKVAFEENSKLEFIGDEAFGYCTSLKYIDIPEGVKFIYNGAFRGCSQLKKVQFPTTLQSLSSHSFYDCEALSEITIPAATTSISHNAFTGCDALMKITVEKDNTVYHSSGNCIIETAVKKLLIGCTGSVFPQDDSVTEIGSWAFGDNACLKKIEISKYIEKIDIMAFYNCGGLEEIIVDEDNPVFHEDGNCLINTEEKKLLRFCSNSTIPSDGSVVRIQDGAFGGCIIQNLYVPACIETVGSSLDGLTVLESIIVEEGNPNFYSSGNCLIGIQSKKLYLGCKNSVIPSGVLTIEIGAFADSEIESINIPASVTLIEYGAFGGCALLKEIRYEGTIEQWLAIEKSSVWDFDAGDYTVICTDGIL